MTNQTQTIAPLCSYCAQPIDSRGSRGWSRPYRPHPDLPGGLWTPTPAGTGTSLGFGLVYCCNTPFCAARAARVPPDAWLIAPLWGMALLRWIRDGYPLPVDPDDPQFSAYYGAED